MPRITDARLPAAPSSDEQVVRRERILTAATRLAAIDGLEHVQMQDIARHAEVALGTLYRYFPSKTQLFAAAFRWRMQALTAAIPEAPDGDVIAGIGEALVTISRTLLAERLLAAAMMQSAVIEATGMPRPTAVESVLGKAVLSRLGITDPEPDDVSMARFLVFSWWGVLVGVLNDVIPDERIDDELRLAARVTLARYARQVPEPER
jgi:AcrR family transcriptional regulator